MNNTVLVLDIKSKSKSKNGYCKFADIISNLRYRGDMSLEDFEMFTNNPSRILSYRTANKIYIVFDQNKNLASYKSFAAGSINIIHNFNDFEGISNNGIVRTMPLSLSLYIQRYGK